ncbi:MAG: CDP-archaeol synthase [Chitinophagales bacterium]|nr:CDP-archaeol synthase [Chitinophagales bacterium]
MIKGFVTRSLSAFVFVAVMAGGILWNAWSFGAVMLLVLIGTLSEFYNITKDKRSEFSPYATTKSRNFVIGISLMLLFITFFTNGGFKDFTSGEGLIAKLLNSLLSRKFTFADIAVFFPAITMLILIHELFSKAEKPFTNIAWNILAIVYITLPILLSFQIFFESGKWILFAIIGLVWINDAMAYSCGILFGKTKMFERLSPKKTIEGLIGGILLTAVAAWFFIKLPIPELQVFSQTQWVILAVVMSAAAVLGDLVESLLKRSLQIKDSGSILPGHGGFLDRFDAFLVAIPFAVLVIWIMQQIGYILTLIEYLG